MPIGGFLDDFPKALFVVAHLVFLVVGLYAIKRASDAGLPYKGPLALYVISQPVFLLFFGGVITIKAAVLTEQTLLVAMVLWMAMGMPKRTTAK